MKWLKICALLLLTLAAMRAFSWALAWAMVKTTTARVRVVAGLANLAGFAAFVGLLTWNLLPGEPLDWPALWFGFSVFLVCAVSDRHWQPWARKARPR